jgi:hypothetical protein
MILDEFFPLFEAELRTNEESIVYQGKVNSENLFV